MVPPSQRYNGRKNVVTAQGTIKKLTKAWKALGIEAKCSTNRGLQAGRFTLYLCQKKSTVCKLSVEQIDTIIDWDSFDNSFLILRAAIWHHVGNKKGRIVLSSFHNKSFIYCSYIKNIIQTGFYYSCCGCK